MNENLINPKFPNRGYIRVSKNEQKRGQSPEAQKNIVKEFLKRIGLKLDKKKPFYDDSGYSASIKEDNIDITIDEKNLIIKMPLNKRPHFKQALIDSKKGEKFNLIFNRFDRFSRNQTFQENTYLLFGQNGIPLVPINDTPDPFTRRLLGILNQRESEMTSKRIKESMKEMFRQGYPVGKPPFGFYYLKDEENKIVKPRQLLTIPEKIEKIKQVFKLTIEGKNYKTICEKLKLNRSTYESILQNKFYIGIVEYKGQQNKSCVPSIISPKDFEEANKKRNQKRKPKYF